MARPVPTPPFPRPVDYGATGEEYGDWLDAVDNGDPVHPGPALSDYLDALDRHQRANYDAEVIPLSQAPHQRRLARHPPPSSPPPFPTPPTRRWTAASGPSPGGASGWSTWTFPAATVGSGSTDSALPSTPDGARHPRTRNPDWSLTMPRSPTSPATPTSRCSSPARTATRSPSLAAPPAPCAKLGCPGRDRRLLRRGNQRRLRPPAPDHHAVDPV